MTETSTDQGGWSERRFAAVWTAVYFVVVLLGLLHHEMWRDEYHVWLLASNSESLRDLLVNMRYDGRPGLWYLILFVVSRFTDQPMAMQGVNLALATGTAWMVLRHAPFGRIFRLAFCFGYFALYEYAIITREYALGMFFAVLFCVRYRDSERPGAGLGMILALLALSNPFAVLLSLVLTGFVAIDRLVLRRPPLGRFGRRIGWTLGLGLSAAMLALWMMRTPADAGFFNFQAKTSGFHLAPLFQAISHVFTGYLPIPQAKIAGWNTNIFAGLGGHGILLASLLILVLGVLVLLRNPRALLMYLAATGGFLAYFYLYPVIPYYLRHSGHLFWVLFMALWLSRTLEPRWRWAWPPWFGRVGAILERPFVGLLLAAQVWASAVSYANDWRHPFTNSKAAAAFLAEAGYESNPIVGALDVYASPFAAIFHHPIFYPERGKFGTFIIFDQKRLRPVTPDMILAPCLGLFQQTGRPVILILTVELNKTVNGESSPIREEPLDNGYVLRLLGEFIEPCMCGDEGYWIYIYDRQAGAAGANRPGE